MLAVDEYGEEVLARIRVLSGGHLLADALDDNGKLVRIFSVDPEAIVDVVRAA